MDESGSEKKETVAEVKEPKERYEPEEDLKAMQKLREMRTQSYIMGRDSEQFADEQVKIAESLHEPHVKSAEDTLAKMDELINKTKANATGEEAKTNK